MSKPQFVYVIYIKAAPEKVWSGLVDPAMTRIYWMHENLSDWKPGSRWEHKRTDPKGTIDIVGEVVEFDPPKRLVVTWVSPKDEGQPEKTSRVTITLDPEGWPNGPWTKLQIVHSELEPDSPMFHSVSYGWPGLMSALKTLLESQASSS